MQLIYHMQAYRLFNRMQREYEDFTLYKYIDCVMVSHKKEHIIAPYPTVLNVLNCEDATNTIKLYYLMKLRELRNVLCN